MLTSISPLGERARGNRWASTVVWLTLGAVAGGAAVGTTAGALGRAALGALSGNSVLLILAASGLLCAAWDWSGQRFPGRRQVNEDWLVAFRPWVYGAGFGAQLGAGVVTVVNTALIPLFLLAALVSADAAAGLVVGVCFGAARGLTLLLGRRVRTTDDLRLLHRRLDTSSQLARRLGAAVAVVLGVGAAGQPARAVRPGARLRRGACRGRVSQ